MDEKTAQVIEKLADKLGVTAEYLWGVLIKQAPIDAAISVAFFALSLFGLFVAYRFVDYMKGKDWDIEGRFALFVVICIASSVILIASLASVGGAITAIINPEYWALQKILGAIK